jgi:hypothetical protein
MAVCGGNLGDIGEPFPRRIGSATKIYGKQGTVWNVPRLLNTERIRLKRFSSNRLMMVGAEGFELSVLLRRAVSVTSIRPAFVRTEETNSGIFFLEL